MTISDSEQKEFYSSVNDETVTDDQYKNAQNICKTFRIKIWSIS